MSEHKAEKTDAVKGYPWLQIPWPGVSGSGVKTEFIKFRLDRRPFINWYDPSKPSHIRNAVNDAFQNTLEPMPPLAPAPDAECIVELGQKGAGRIVYARPEKLPLICSAVTERPGSGWTDPVLISCL